MIEDIKIRWPKLPTKNIVSMVITADDDLWCLLDYEGQNLLVKIDWDTGAWLFVNAQAGVNSHGLIQWKNGFLILSSGNSRLIHATPEGTDVLWQGEHTFRKNFYLHGTTVHFGSDYEQVEFDLISKEYIVHPRSGSVHTIS
jgi:hypothetical protein